MAGRSVRSAATSIPFLSHSIRTLLKDTVEVVLQMRCSFTEVGFIGSQLAPACSLLSLCTLVAFALERCWWQVLLNDELAWSWGWQGICKICSKRYHRFLLDLVMWFFFLHHSQLWQSYSARCSRGSEGLSLLMTVAKRMQGKMSKWKNLLEGYQIWRKLLVKCLRCVCFSQNFIELSMLTWWM